MNKYLKITCIAVLIFSILLSGCTQETNNNNNVNKEEIQLISHEIETNPSGDIKEVRGSLKNIGNRTINPVVVEVIFYNKNNLVIHSGTYTIYNFVNGYTEYFFVQFKSTDPNYEEYDHYSIELDYV